MAWIESHQELARHPKTKKLARLIGASLPAAVGHLHFLWWWAMDYAQDGDLSRYDEHDIADACGWEGDARELFDALVEAGFIDRTEDGVFVHDWDDYAGRLLERRKANTERKRKSRARHADVTRDTPDSHRATEPNQTVPNQYATAAAHARASQPEQEPFPAAYRRVYNRDLTPYQAEELGAYIDQDGFDEAVVVRAIERAALAGGGIKLILHILNDYAAAGAKTLEGAIAFDAEHEARRQRGDPKASRQSRQLNVLNQLEREFENRDTG